MCDHPQQPEEAPRLNLALLLTWTLNKEGFFCRFRSHNSDSTAWRRPVGNLRQPVGRSKGRNTVFRHLSRLPPAGALSKQLAEAKDSGKQKPSGAETRGPSGVDRTSLCPAFSTTADSIISSGGQGRNCLNIKRGFSA